jgi:5-methylcytosine-specific restriction endonuclease McrA
MPIKPENKHRYPANWKEIRAAILLRAGHRCEFCGLANYAIGYRDNNGVFEQLALLGRPEFFAGHASGFRVFRIVLTIAHMDHVPEHCDEENLKALCQKCHLNYDHPHHRISSAKTRRAQKMNLELFTND